MKTISIADAKARFSELIGEVACDRVSVLITKRGRPMAKLVPVDAPVRKHLVELDGWLDEDDPFFDAIDTIIAERAAS